MGGAQYYGEGACFPVDFCQWCTGLYWAAPPPAVGVVTDALGARHRVCARHAAAYARLGRILKGKGQTRADRAGAPARHG